MPLPGYVGKIEKADPSGQKGLQGGGKVGELEGKFPLLKPGWMDLLAAQCQRCRFAQKAEQSWRNGDAGTAVEVLSQCRNELVESDGLWCNGIVDTIPRLRNRCVDGADEILDVDPAYPLATIAGIGAQTIPVATAQQMEKSSIRLEHNPDSRDYHPNVLPFGCLHRRIFPGDAEAGKEIVAGGTLFIAFALTQIAVVTNCGSGNEGKGAGCILPNSGG